jgi:hypothetical protein
LRIVASIDDGDSLSYAGMKLCDLGHLLWRSRDLVVHHKGLTDQAIAPCGGHTHEAVKGLVAANEFLESEICELMQAVWHA